MFIYPYRPGSQSVRGLKRGLGAKIILLENSRFKGDENKNVINWGNSTPFDELDSCNLLNHPEQVNFATSKLNFFNMVQGEVNIPEFTQDRSVAHSWIQEGKIVVVREKLTGHSGDGIVLLESIDEWEDYNHNDAKLYVKYIPKRAEYRLHVFKGRVIDAQKKSTVHGEQPVTYRIQSHDNGFIFTRGNIDELPEGAEDMAIKAIEICGLDFGAVDIIYNEYRNKCYVLEVNTAPGLEGQTLTNYTNAFANYFGQEVIVTEPIRPEGPPIRETQGLRRSTLLDNIVWQTVDD